jgi:lipopolysaccharide export system protein LptA
MLKPILMLTAVLALGLTSVQADAQQANIAFSGMKQDTSLPVTLDADTLAINNADGTALFTGNVVVSQGEMRLTAGEVRVEYTPDGGGIKTLHATGGVTLVNATDAAEAKEAVYTIDSGNVVMTGDVLLTQGKNAISGQKLVINLKGGTGVMEGRVQTVFAPGVKK